MTAGSSHVLSPTAQAFRALMEDVYGGRFDVCFKRCATMEVSVAEVVNGEPIDQCEDLVNAFQKAMRGCGSLEVVAASASGAPPRALKRNSSEDSNADETGAAERERDQLWKTAQAERKKYVNIITVPRMTQEALTAAYQKCPIQNFAGAKDSHRAFFCSADLMCENPHEPWARLAVPSETVLRSVCDCMKEFKGGHDFIVLGDGRSKETSLRMHTYMAGRPHGTELLLLYTGRNTTQLGQRRKIALSAQSVESILVFSPVSRTLLSTKPRSTFNALGETSTYDTTYSGITFRARGGIPRLSEKDKKEIVGDHSPSGCRRHSCQLSGPIQFCSGKRRSRSTSSRLSWRTWTCQPSLMCPQDQELWRRLVYGWVCSMLA